MLALFWVYSWGNVENYGIIVCKMCENVSGHSLEIYDTKGVWGGGEILV
jgi:hypothetical protein